MYRVLFFRTGAAGGRTKSLKELKVLVRRKPFTFSAWVVYLFEEGARAICFAGAGKKGERG